MDKNKLKSLLISPDSTIKQVIQKLNETQEKIVFVVDGDDKLLGTLNDGDIRRAIINGVGFNDLAEKIMNPNFVSATYEPEIAEHARQLMLSTKALQIPVQNDEGVIVDIILWTDILEGKKQQAVAELHDNQVVVMAGGKGARLDPFTKILPKPLIPIGNKPVIEIIMEMFFQHGFHKFTYTLNYKKEYIKLFLKEVNAPYTIDYIEEKEFLGTAGSLALLKDSLKDTFFVTNCDSLMDANFESILEWHKENDAAVTIVGSHNEFKIPFGVLELSDGRVEKILEKPVHDQIINTGVYVLEPRVLSYIPEGEHIDMNELLEKILEHEKVTVYPIYDGWFDIGQWKEYQGSLERLKALEDA